MVAKADRSFRVQALKRCSIFWTSLAMLCANGCTVRLGLLRRGLLRRGLLMAAVACLAWNAVGQSSPDAQALRKVRARRFLSGRRVPGVGSAAALDHARQQHLAMLKANPLNSVLSTAWTAVGPAQVATQSFGLVTGRVTALAIDQGDSTGNTIYVGTTGGGVWKSSNAAGPQAAVTFAPLTDTLSAFNGTTQVTPSLSIGAMALANGVLLAGTGDPNDATDSYYGVGILRSADGGVTWTLAQQSLDGVTGNHSFFGLSVAGLAFSSSNPSLVVAALSQSAEAVLVNAETASVSQMGLYYSADAGMTWHMATIMDGSQTVQSPLMPGSNGGGNAATAVVWNPKRAIYVAAVRYHGYYGSTDGMTWTRLASQPGVGLTTTACPTDPSTSGSPGCPIFRGALAVQAASGDTFALTVDAENRDQGLYQDACALSGTACGNASVSFATRLNAAPLETGGGSTVIPQADYDLALAAAPWGTDTLLYAGAIDLYRCSLAAGCALRNTTNAENGCTNPALVAPAQHALALLPNTAGPLLYLGNDGGLWRSTDGVDELAAPCSLDDATHFQNLNGGLGSLAEVVSFAQDPSAAGTLLVGLGGLGTAGTNTVTKSWTQLAAGEGGTVAIDANNPLLWYLSTGAGINIAGCSKGAACEAQDFTTTSIGAAQVANDESAIHAPWLLDPAASSNLVAGTCRVWRGPASGGALWTASNSISAPFGAGAATACNGTLPVVRSLAAGGTANNSSNAQNSGSEVLYAGLAGTLDGGVGYGGHLFATLLGNMDSKTTQWTDRASANVVNDVADAGLFNPGGFDISSVAVDPHDTTGETVYATVMGFAANGINAPHVYRSTDAGSHWTNISSNLPNAPANSVAIDPNDANTVYVALDTGVYATASVTNCAASNCWSVYGTVLPNSPVVQLAAGAGLATGDGRVGELRAATYGRGIWQIPLLTASSPAMPAMALSPTSLSFPAQQVGTLSGYGTITVTNTGNAVLQISSVVTSGDFVELDTCSGSAVAQNTSCAVQVQFAPSATGSRNGLLTVYGNVAGGQATALLSGTGTPPAAIVLTPLSLSFPATSVGATSAVQNVTVANTGGTTATLQGAVIAGDFAISANTCGSTLASSTSCTVSVVFAPKGSGTRAGTLTIVDSVGMQVAALLGTATNPATDSLAPLTLSFAPTQLSSASAAQAVTLTNAGDVALTLIAASILSGDFSVVNSCGNSLNAHSSCAMIVTFAPKSVGSQAGSLAVSDQFRTQTVALSGTGLAPPGVSLSPTNGLSFGVIGLGLASAPQTLTLTNNGGVPLALASVAATGDFAIVTGSNTCGSSLAPAAVCTLQVVFSPAAAGARTGTVTITDNAGNSPQAVALTGTGVDFALASNGPSSLTLASGQTATFALLLSSVAGLPGSVSFTCAGVPAHSTCMVNPSPAGLGGSTSVTVTIATGLSTVRLEPPMLPWQKQLTWLALLLPCGVVVARRRKFSGVAGALLLGVLAGCSASRTLPATSAPGTNTTVVTPSGSYTIVVAGSSAGLVRAVNLTLVVQ